MLLLFRRLFVSRFDCTKLSVLVPSVLYLLLLVQYMESHFCVIQVRVTNKSGESSIDSGSTLYYAYYTNVVHVLCVLCITTGAASTNAAF